MSQSVPAAVEATEANSTMVHLVRLTHGWPKKRLAELAGVSASHVSRVEIGRLPLAGKALRDYAAALGCRPELLCVPYAKTPAEGTHFRANLSAAEWKRDRVLAQANIAAMRIGRMVQGIDLEPAVKLPTLDPDDYAAEYGEITVAQILRRYWRIAGPVPSVISLLESAGMFVISTMFPDNTVDAITLRANTYHPHLIFVNSALPADRLRVTLGHELGHLVMDEMTLADPAILELRATSFAVEFLAPFHDIADDLCRVSPRTLHELDELRMRWGVSASSLVVRAHDQGMLSDYQYRTMFRQLNETGRLYGERPEVAHEQPRLASHILDQLTEAGYDDDDLDAITMLTTQERAALFGHTHRPPTVQPRRLTLV